MDKEKTDKGGLSLATLAISSASAVAAAVIIPLFWERGTLIATALTPIVVALVSEALKKPATAIGSAAPLVASRARARPTSRRPADDVHPQPAQEAATGPGGGRIGGDDPFGLREPERRGVRRHWRVALATGVAALVVAVVGLTASELVFGGPATAEGGRTTFFSSRSWDGERDPEPTPEATATPDAQGTPAPGATPEPTATPGATPLPENTPTIPTPTPTPPPTGGQPAPEASPTPAPGP